MIKHQPLNILTIVILFVAVVWVSVAQPPSTDEILEQVQAYGHARVIVELDFAFTPYPLLNSAQRNTQFTALNQARSNLVQSLQVQGLSAQQLSTDWHAPYIALEVDADTVEALRNSPNVRSIRLDRYNKPFLSLSESTSFINAPAYWNDGYDGGTAEEAVSVVIIDTGVEASHPFFEDSLGQSRIVRQACFSSAYTSLCRDHKLIDTLPDATAEPYSNCDVTSPTPLCNHGTHVAGIAAGYGMSFSGVAKGANIIAIQVFHLNSDPEICNPDPTCLRASDIDVLNALSYVYSLTQNESSLNIAAVNLSLGSSVSYQGTCDDTPNEPLFPSGYGAIAAQLRTAKVITVAASGNGGLTGSLSSPACVPGIVSVGSVDITSPSTPVVSPYSNTATFLDFLAPGGQVQPLSEGEIYQPNGVESSVPGNTYRSLSGTSMSAPHVTGAFALLRQRFPSATADELEQELRGQSEYFNYSRNGEVFSTYLLKLSIADASCIEDQSSFADAINFANTFSIDNVINICRNTIIELTQALPQIESSIFINGNGSVIDGGLISSGRIFTVGTGAALTLDDVTLQNGTVGNNEGGGAIYNPPAGYVIITNSILDNNQGGYGGAIFNEGELIIANTTFTNNRSLSQYQGGGAISIGGTVTLINVVCASSNISVASGDCIENNGELRSIATEYQHASAEDAVFSENGTVIFEGRVDPISLDGLTTGCEHSKNGIAVQRFTGGFSDSGNTGSRQKYNSGGSERDVAFTVYDSNGNIVACVNGSAVQRFTGGFDGSHFFLETPANQTSEYTVVVWDVTRYQTAENTGLASGNETSGQIDDLLAYSIESGLISATTLPAPYDTPLDVNSAIETNSQGIKITWATYTSFDSDMKFIIERAEVDDFIVWEHIALVGAESLDEQWCCGPSGDVFEYVYQDTSIKAGVTYAYRIRAYKAGVTVGGDQISDVTDDTVRVATAVACTACTPVEIQALPDEDTAVYLSWFNNSAEVISFTIERYDEANPMWVTAGVVGTAEFTDSNLSCETWYQYRLSATDSSNYTSPTSVPIDVFTGPCSATDLTAKHRSDNTVLITWTDQSNTESSYILEKSLDSGASWSAVESLRPNSRYFVDPNRNCNALYRIITMRNDAYSFDVDGNPIHTPVWSDEIPIVLCPDYNLDGVVSPSDAVGVINRIGTGDLAADIDKDDDVDSADVQVILDAIEGNP